MSTLTEVSFQSDDIVTSITRVKREAGKVFFFTFQWTLLIEGCILELIPFFTFQKRLDEGINL